jgi:hypothetical protein
VYKSFQCKLAGCHHSEIKSNFGGGREVEGQGIGNQDKYLNLLLTSRLQVHHRGAERDEIAQRGNFFFCESKKRSFLPRNAANKTKHFFFFHVFADWVKYAVCM